MVFCLCFGVFVGLLFPFFQCLNVLFSRLIGGRFNKLLLILVYITQLKRSVNKRNNTHTQTHTQTDTQQHNTTQTHTHRQRREEGRGRGRGKDNQPTDRQRNNHHHNHHHNQTHTHNQPPPEKPQKIGLEILKTTPPPPKNKSLFYTGLPSYHL